MQKKSLMDFYPRKRSKDGYNSRCKICFGRPKKEIFVKILTKEFLIESYINKDLSIEEVSKIANCSAGTIRNYLIKLNIFKRDKFKDFKDILTKSYLVENYTNKKLSCPEIAKEVGCNYKLVNRCLVKFNIIRRNTGEARKNKPNFKLRGHPVYKSKERNKKISEALKGDKCYWWYIDGRTPLHNAIRNLQANVNWRDQIFRRDNYKCQECDKGGYLEAHHIKEFSIILKEFLQIYSQFSPIEDKETLLRLAIDYREFWDTSNGKTLCLDCHDRTYKKCLKQ